MKSKFLRFTVLALCVLSFAACSSAKPKVASYHPGDVIETKLSKQAIVIDTPAVSFCGCGDHDYIVRYDGINSSEEIKEVEIDHKVK